MTRKETQSDYWQSFGAYARARGSRFGGGGSENGSYKSWGVGRTGYKLSAAVRLEYDGPGGLVAFEVEGTDAASDYARLLLDRPAVEQELGSAADWEETAGQRRRSISVVGGPSGDDRSLWPDLHRWTLDQLEAFDRTFRLRI